MQMIRDSVEQATYDTKWSVGSLLPLDSTKKASNVVSHT